MSDQYLNLPLAPADVAFGLMAEYEADPHPNKVSLIAGAYRDEDGRHWVLPSVKEAKARLTPDQHHEYLGIAGSPALIKLTQSLTFPSPTWINHKSIWASTGVQIEEYPYYEPVAGSVDIDSMLATLETATPRDVVILQACAHNPTGVDLSRAEWTRVAEVVKRKNLFAVFDSAYQGFATGDVDGDAWAVRYFAEQLILHGQPDRPGLCVAQSFSKNFGLYGERVGAIHLVVPRHLSAKGALSELIALARAEYSNPPRFGASIVETVLGDGELRAQWQRDLETMNVRIQAMRLQLRKTLEDNGTPGDWAFIPSQIGMFNYTGLGREQVDRLRKGFHIYLLPSGRASICGLNEGNVGYVARAIREVVGSGHN
ncbi:aspartate aminotransferase [Aspergillus ellipticus CBS 707.79]|uniref:Aspartate aminotransferase n=1 Tax=Aspergillus ellipticus CBS 707.79 TaxID=1448320 RepID=A0A319E0P3_9EURO|nr:aspartate aminotransferase [Aspergillus ellipticus CBS 707.79]